jgi:glucosamine--fructose-6-phosphate aminotransferase (isomerizing)
LRRLAAELRDKGANLFRADPGAGEGAALAALPPDHPDADAICLIQSFYRMVAQLAAARHVDPDRPRHLQKVTRTR